MASWQLALRRIDALFAMKLGPLSRTRTTLCRTTRSSVRVSRSASGTYFNGETCGVGGLFSGAPQKRVGSGDETQSLASLCFVSSGQPVTGLSGAFFGVHPKKVPFLAPQKSQKSPAIFDLGFWILD
jgi:hypothetical protein